jgi:hypothetical protein
MPFCTAENVKWFHEVLNGEGHNFRLAGNATTFRYSLAARYCGGCTKKAYFHTPFRRPQYRSGKPQSLTQILVDARVQSLRWWKPKIVHQWAIWSDHPHQYNSKLAQWSPCRLIIPAFVSQTYIQISPWENLTAKEITVAKIQNRGFTAHF